MKKNYIFALLLMLSLAFPALGSGFLYLPGPANGGGGGGSATPTLAAPAFIRMKAASTVARASDAGSNTRMYFQTTIDTGGTGLTLTSTAAGGTYVRVATAGWYYVMVSGDVVSAMTVKVNSALNNTLALTDTDQQIGYTINPNGNHIGGMYKCNANDYIWVANTGGLNNYPEMHRFTVMGPVFGVAS